jgi:hypothetical protein
MLADGVLVHFVYGFWGLLAAAVKVSNWLAGKSWSDGPSLLPMFLVFPLIAVIMGWMINQIASPYGTCVVAGIHLISIPGCLVVMWWYNPRG